MSRFSFCVSILEVFTVNSTFDFAASFGSKEKVPEKSLNVPFTLPKEELDKSFLAKADAAGLTNLKGHRSVGGMRASIYNAMPAEGVTALVGFMKEFERKHG